MVSEKIIDGIIEELDKLTDEQYEAKMEAFAKAQPVVVAYLFNEENFQLLSDEETGFLQYLSLIIWASLEKAGLHPDPVSEEMIGEAEERNYGMLEDSDGKNFRARLDPFFDGYEEEDLLAFVEEAVLEDEGDPDSFVTREGREVIFVAGKTIVDVLTAKG